MASEERRIVLNLEVTASKDLFLSVHYLDSESLSSVPGQY